MAYQIWRSIKYLVAMITTMCVAREDIRAKWPLYDLKLQPLPPWKLPMIKWTQWWLSWGSYRYITSPILAIAGLHFLFLNAYFGIWEDKESRIRNLRAQHPTLLLLLKSEMGNSKFEILKRKVIILTKSCGHSPLTNATDAGALSLPQTQGSTLIFVLKSTKFNPGPPGLHSQ